MSREAFEQWASAQTFLIKAGDDYINIKPMMWEVWQAALESQQAAQPQVTECRWVDDDDGVYDTGCGNRFEFVTDGPDENNAHFCMYCGGKLLTASQEQEKGE